MIVSNNKTNCFGCNLKLELLGSLTDDQLKRVNSNRHNVHFSEGETIFKYGGPLTHYICITSGMAKIFLEDSNNDKRILLNIAKPVQTIGGPGFLVDEMNYITVVAMEETSACFIKTDIFKELMLENPEFTMHLLKIRNEKSISYFKKLMDLTHKQIHGKVADTILYLSDYVYKSDKFETKLSRQDLADMAAITKESVIRVLKQFNDDGIIECHNHSFDIQDKEALLKISKTG